MSGGVEKTQAYMMDLSSLKNKNNSKTNQNLGMLTSCVNKNTDNMIQLALDFVLKLHGNTLINNKKK